MAARPILGSILCPFIGMELSIFHRKVFRNRENGLLLRFLCCFRWCSGCYLQQFSGCNYCWCNNVWFNRTSNYNHGCLWNTELNKQFLLIDSVVALNTKPKRNVHYYNRNLLKSSQNQINNLTSIYEITLSSLVYWNATRLIFSLCLHPHKYSNLNINYARIDRIKCRFYV